MSPPVPLYHIYTTYTTFKTKKFDKKRPAVGGFARILGLFNCQSTVLKTAGVVGAIYIIGRSVGKLFGAWLGARAAHAPAKVGRYLGPCLLPQAGVAIGLTLLAGRVVPEYAPVIRAVVLAGTLIYEIVGPGITKFCLLRAGEISGSA